MSKKRSIKTITRVLFIMAIPELIALIILLRIDAGRAAQTVEVAAVGQSSTALTSVSSSSKEQSQSSTALTSASSSSKAQSQSSTVLTNVSSSSKEQSVDSVEEVSSAAENSTSQKSFTYMKGDVDADGMLTYADLELLKRLVDTDLYIEPQQFYSADMDNNNKIDTVDVAMLKQLLN